MFYDIIHLTIIERLILQMNTKNELEFENIISELLVNTTVQQMDNYRQHYNTSCLEHCKHVAYYNYIICKKLGLDYKLAARAGLLHDLFLYDWRKRQPGRRRLHAFYHPRTSLENAKKLFILSPKEEDIILKHMRPLTIILPKYPESYIITFTDKYCTLVETFNYYSNLIKSKILKINT